MYRRDKLNPSNLGSVKMATTFGTVSGSVVVVVTSSSAAVAASDGEVTSLLSAMGDQWIAEFLVVLVQFLSCLVLLRRVRVQIYVGNDCIRLWVGWWNALDQHVSVSWYKVSTGAVRLARAANFN